MTDIDFLPCKDAKNYPLPLSEALKELINNLRQQALSQFVEGLASALEEENYQFTDLLDCLASFADARPELSPAVKGLEQAVEELLTARRAGVGEPSSE